MRPATPTRPDTEPRPARFGGPIARGRRSVLRASLAVVIVIVMIGWLLVPFFLFQSGPQGSATSDGQALPGVPSMPAAPAPAMADDPSGRDIESEAQEPPSVPDGPPAPPAAPDLPSGTDRTPVGVDAEVPDLTDTPEAPAVETPGDLTAPVPPAPPAFPDAPSAAKSPSLPKAPALPKAPNVPTTPAAPTTPNVPTAPAAPADTAPTPSTTPASQPPAAQPQPTPAASPAPAAPADPGPVAGDDHFVTNDAYRTYGFMDFPVFDNDADRGGPRFSDGSPFRTQSVSVGTHGDLEATSVACSDGSGRWCLRYYNHHAGPFSDRFTYTIVDAGGTRATATVTIDVP